MNHELHIEGKQRIEVTEVHSVEEFDESTICLNLQDEDLVLYGNGLHIEALDLDTGVLTASGEIESLTYRKKILKKGLLQRFRK